MADDNEIFRNQIISYVKWMRRRLNNANTNGVEYLKQNRDSECDQAIGEGAAFVLAINEAKRRFGIRNKDLEPSAELKTKRGKAK